LFHINDLKYKDAGEENGSPAFLLAASGFYNAGATVASCYAAAWFIL